MVSQLGASTVGSKRVYSERTEFSLHEQRRGRVPTSGDEFLRKQTRYTSAQQCGRDGALLIGGPAATFKFTQAPFGPASTGTETTVPPRRAPMKGGLAPEDLLKRADSPRTRTRACLQRETPRAIVHPAELRRWAVRVIDGSRSSSDGRTHPGKAG